MIKKFTLVIALVIGASSIPVQAARTPGSIAWNSTKVLGALWLVWRGGNAVVNSLSAKERKKRREDFEKFRAEARERVRSQGGDLEEFDEAMNAYSKIETIGIVIGGFVGAIMVVGGAWLGYKGIQGLRKSGPSDPDEPTAPDVLIVPVSDEEPPVF